MQLNPGTLLPDGKPIPGVCQPYNPQVGPPVDRTTLEHAIGEIPLPSPSIRNQVIEIAKLWPGHRDVNYDSSTTENLLALIRDAVADDRRRLKMPDQPPTGPQPLASAAPDLFEALDALRRQFFCKREDQTDEEAQRENDVLEKVRAAIKKATKP